MFACSIAAGSTFAFPNVCKTPMPPAPSPVPIPYPNMAQMAMGNPPVVKILIGGAPALNQGSKIPLSNGDEAGVAGGLVSGSNMQECKFLKGSLTVSFAGKAAIRNLDPVQANKGNAIGMIQVPSQFTVSVGG